MAHGLHAFYSYSVLQGKDGQFGYFVSKPVSPCSNSPWPQVTSPRGLEDLLRSGARLPEVSGGWPWPVSSLLRRCGAEQPLLRPSAAEVTETLRSALHISQSGVQEDTTAGGHYKIPNQIVPSRSFYYKNYKILKGNPVTVTAKEPDETNDNGELCEV